MKETKGKILRFSEFPATRCLPVKSKDIIKTYCLIWASYNLESVKAPCEGYQQMKMEVEYMMKKEKGDAGEV